MTISNDGGIEVARAYDHKVAAKNRQRMLKNKLDMEPHPVNATRLPKL